MKNIVIKTENVGKQYRLGLVSTGTLSHDLNRWWAKIRKKEDPTLKIDHILTPKEKRRQGYIWALRDLNLEIKEGEILGIIGKNGAGKSTLLKLFSRITTPTTGVIKIKGKVGSLLEVGTGFHPELTGMENIFLNGAILGMTKSEIKKRIDQIIDFSGIEKFVETPVKRYSSGMYVRLAFAVAAHLEPNILLVDEVLAVGDADFQKKCLGKMDDVAQKKGRTVLFVSHNMHAVMRICKKTIVLSSGSIEYAGDTDKAVNYYLKSGMGITTRRKWSDITKAPGNAIVRLLEVRVHTEDGTVK
ncbi:MAG: ABC transporter ATP-binding protein, partial [bacterium]